MSLPTGTFSSQYSGTLRITATATWFENHGSTNQGWHEVGTNNANIQIRAYAGPSGALTYGTPFDKYNPSVTHDVDYPGGGAVWLVGVEELGYIPGTALHYGYDPIKLTIQLIKK